MPFNIRIRELALEAHKQAVSNTIDGGKSFDVDIFEHKFAELILNDCIKYLTDEINRLNEYRAALEQDPQHNELFIDQVDVCIDKCQDNIQGLKERFGITD